MVALATSDWFEITKEGFVTEKKIPVLKESGLAISDKPSAAERIQQGIPSTSINLSGNRKKVNYFIITPFKCNIRVDRSKSLQLAVA